MRSREQNIAELTGKSKIQKLQNWMDLDENKIKELIKNKNNVDKLRSILASMSKEEWLSNIFEAYDAVIVAMTNDIIDKYKELAEEVGREEYRIKKEVIPEKKVRVPTTPIKNIRVTRKDGTVYYRSKAQKWNTKEETFVKTRTDLPIKDLGQAFSIKFGYIRSNQSLKAKRLRLKNLEAS
jgi:hypothetical protein